MPEPTSLVEKNGSKMRSRFSWRDADAGVGDLDLHIIAGRHDLVPAPQRGRLARLAVRMVERAAVRHGVAGIDREIDDHLLELALIDLDEAEIAAMHDLRARCSRR